MSSISIQKVCEKNPTTIQLSNEEIYYLTSFEPDEIQVNTSITFISPSNIINEDEYYLNNVKYNLSFSGDYTNNSLYISNLLSDLNDLNQGLFTYDTDKCLYKNRLLLQNDQEFTLMTKSQKFCNVFGFNPSIEYKSIYNDKNKKYEILAPKKMYTLNYRQIKIQCFEIEDYNFIEFGKQCKYILKDAYFSYVNTSGQLVTIQSQFPSIFKTSQFTKDLYLNVVDETGKSIEFEDAFKLTFQISTSQRLIQKRITDAENLQQQQQEEDSLKSQQQEAQEQQMQQQMQSLQQQYNYYLQVFRGNVQIINNLRGVVKHEIQNIFIKDKFRKYNQLLTQFTNIQFQQQVQIQQKIYLLKQVIQTQECIIQLLQDFQDQTPELQEIQEEQEDYISQEDLYKILTVISDLKNNQQELQNYIQQLPQTQQEIAKQIYETK